MGNGIAGRKTNSELLCIRGNGDTEAKAIRADVGIGAQLLARALVAVQASLAIVALADVLATVFPKSLRALGDARPRVACDRTLQAAIAACLSCAEARWLIFKSTEVVDDRGKLRARIRGASANTITAGYGASQ